ncbi:YdcF family protein [Candidatus Merdisoma sp. JLR.KK011]|uniref:YdcF family protein n=1 Tax=Candidatus Merdisoma sp. JLR.KK011 TaxID=3114299 RepID=UPI002FF0F4A9
MKFIEDITDFIFVEHQPEKADVIFIPGGDQGALAVTAAKLYRGGYAPWVLPSGRFSKPVGRCMIPGYETEWEFLRDILVEHGVPKEAVLEERQATFTYENAIFSRKVTDAFGIEVKRAILCPQACHARRALLYYEVLYPDAEFFVCPTVTREISRENWFLEDWKIDVVLGEMEKCGGQFYGILKEGRWDGSVEK